MNDGSKKSPQPSLSTEPAGGHVSPGSEAPVHLVPASVKLRDRLREQTQTAILDAAEAVLAEEGLALARIDAIASRAGVSVGTLYNHFGDRDGIIKAVLEHHHRIVQGGLTAVLDAPAPTFHDDLCRFLNVFADHSRKHGPFFAVVLNAGRADRGTDFQRDETTVAIRNSAIQLMERGTREQVLRPRGDTLHAELFLALVRSQICQTVMGCGTPVSAAELVDFFLHGAGAPAR